MPAGNPTQPVNLDQYPPYLQGVDDQGDAPYAADNALAALATDNPTNVLTNEAAYRQAVLALLTEIRDLLADGIED